MIPGCPNCNSSSNKSDTRSRVVCHGHYSRSSDDQVVQRYLCKGCGHGFSQASSDPCRWQKKRFINRTVLELLVGGFSQRRSALVLRVNRKTIVRKFLFMGEIAFRSLSHLNSIYPKVQKMEFDDLETFEHTKFKPVSVVLVVEHKSRRILGFRVASMPAKGKIATRARIKYGLRKDERREKRDELFNEIKHFVTETAEIRSDQNPYYPSSVKKHFPGAQHITSQGRRGCVVGQGELKRGGFDPLFSLNHTCAMLRANINRLFRRTWCTTKRVDRLSLHIALYSIYHNLVLLKDSPFNKTTFDNGARLALKLN